MKMTKVIFPGVQKKGPFILFVFKAFIRALQISWTLYHRCSEDYKKPLCHS